MALVLYSLIVVWFHRLGHLLVRFPDRPWYPQKEGPSFADMLSTLRRVSWEEKLWPLLPRSRPLKNWVARLIEFVSRSGSGEGIACQTTARSDHRDPPVAQTEATERGTYA